MENIISFMLPQNDWCTKSQNYYRKIYVCILQYYIWNKNQFAGYSTKSFYLQGSSKI